ncbi:unnamed protein product [Rangifer tarandus platyrhynchus]|uniref:Uncharacterized protein n=1 Tax=Rangifer tarandus platyrhynchus TaxID=3082113 RepID=A0AC59ZS07_RANTA
MWVEVPRSDTPGIGFRAGERGSRQQLWALPSAAAGARERRASDGGASAAASSPPRPVLQGCSWHWGVGKLEGGAPGEPRAARGAPAAVLGAGPGALMGFTPCASACVCSLRPRRGPVRLVRPPHASERAGPARAASSSSAGGSGGAGSALRPARRGPGRAAAARRSGRGRCPARAGGGRSAAPEPRARRGGAHAGRRAAPCWAAPCPAGRRRRRREEAGGERGAAGGRAGPPAARRESASPRRAWPGVQTGDGWCGGSGSSLAPGSLSGLTPANMQNYRPGRS